MPHPKKAQPDFFRRAFSNCYFCSDLIHGILEFLASFKLCCF